MILNVFSIEKNIKINNVEYIKFYIENKSYIIMDNHIKNICRINELVFYINKKKNIFLIKNGLIFQCGGIINIICDYYEFL